MSMLAKRLVRVSVLCVLGCVAAAAVAEKTRPGDVSEVAPRAASERPPLSDADMANLRAGIVPPGAPDAEWCGTQKKWEAKGLGGMPAGGGCPTNGMCDVPAVRNSWISSPPITVNIHFNVFANTNGSNPTATQAEVDAQVIQLNSDFAPAGVSFCPTTTFINDSTYRDYSAGTEEAGMKNTYAVSPATRLNVYVVNTPDFGGRGTFPWDPEALGNLGGIEIDDNAFGPGQSTLTHEVGHNLGLWHTHHGVSEVAACGPCYERADGLNADTTGDFAGDTDPTPTNFNCAGPGGNDACSATPWGPTDPQNYMGYAPDSCWSEFSPHQFGRMHCWYDQVLTSWSCIGAPGEAKFSQVPDNTGELIESDLDWSDTTPNVVNADDFLSDGRPVHGVLWWGMDLVGPAVASASAPAVPLPSLPTESAVVFAAETPPTQAEGSSVAVGGDTCATATVIGAVPYSDTGNTTGFADNYDEECPDVSGNTGGRDVVYSFTPGANVNVDITLCDNSAYDTKLYVYESVCNAPGSGIWEACSDDLCTTPSFAQPYVSAVSNVALSAFTTYYIIVDGWSGSDFGNYTLDINTIVCGDGIVGGDEDCDPPDGVTCNAFCQFIVCGNGVVDGIEQCDPPNGYDCSNTCTFVPVFPIDGWLISFHEPLATGGSAETPLGLYFCDKSVISIQRKGLASCDFQPVNEYRVALADCCLIHAYPDSRNATTPAQDDAFHETACFPYDLDIQAVVGAKWVDSGGTCIEIPTANSAPAPFWGWHTTGIEEGSRGALTTSVSMSGSDWLYGPWSAAATPCSDSNMAFQVLTDTPEPPGGQDCDDNGIYDVCESGADCQPNQVFDHCDIANGTSNDCQPNTIPDECEIAGGAPDCQPDGVPDSCQLAGNDANANGVPDQCDPAPPVAGPPPDKNRVLTLSGIAVLKFDDGVAEDSIGVNNGATGTAFGWAVRFKNLTASPIVVDAVDVAFGSSGGGGALAIGDDVDGVIWIDAAATGNMTNAIKAAQWSLPGGVHAINATYKTFDVPAGGVMVPAGADYYVGMGDIQTQLDSLIRFPASIDQNASDTRSWAFFRPGSNVFDPDNFVGQAVDTIDALGLPGDWLIRARLGGSRALRVRMTDLQNVVPPNAGCCPAPDFSTFEAGTCTASGESAGCARWVGPLFTYYESADLPTQAQSFRAARLQCSPYYNDWSNEGFFHVYGADIVPSSSYEVSAYGSICAGNEGSCADVSPPIVLNTSRWGDLTAPFQPPVLPLTQPNGLDVTNAVNAFRHLTGAPLKVLVKLHPDLLNMHADVNALDITNDVDGFRGFAYSYDGPCACPSTVICNATACPPACAGGGLCVRECNTGPKLGEICTSDVQCGYCVGGTRDTLPCDADSDCTAGGGACTEGTCGPGACRDRCGRCSPP
jgi:hypothetical protein